MTAREVEMRAATVPNRPAVVALFVAFFLSIVASPNLVADDGGQAAPGSPAPRVILGILGGMGPEATANLYELIVQITPAKRDQDHVPTLIYSFPQVPDRTAAVTTGNTSIVPYLVEGVLGWNGRVPRSSSFPATPHTSSPRRCTTRSRFPSWT